MLLTVSCWEGGHKLLNNFELESDNWSQKKPVDYLKNCNCCSCTLIFMEANVRRRSGLFTSCVTRRCCCCLLNLLLGRVAVLFFRYIVKFISNFSSIIMLMKIFGGSLAILVATLVHSGEKMVKLS